MLRAGMSALAAVAAQLQRRPAGNYHAAISSVNVCHFGTFLENRRLCKPRSTTAMDVASGQLAGCPGRRAASTRGILTQALQSQISLLEARHAELSKTMTGGTPVDPKDMARLGRELNSLEKVVAAISSYRVTEAEIADLVAMCKDASASTPDGQELLRMAEEELSALRPSLEDSAKRLISLLVPKDDADDRNVIVEFRPGVGGEEAALFAGELMRMYEAYATVKGWEWKPMTIQMEEAYGGVKEATISVAGEGAYGRLKFERGVHRVQRVPITQSTGKLQTSTATVTVLPEAEEVDIDIKPSDLRIDTYRAGGAGGQHVNTTDSAVRITHIPSGVVVAIQDERSQTQNKAKAMRVLRARLFEAERERLASTRSNARKSQIGSSARSERIRTYNFMQNRITDHRINESKYDVTAFMAGEDLDSFIELLTKLEQDEQLEELEETYRQKLASDKR